eukprot:COSAG05_NODE_2534_length_2934_cov_1.471958_4_plen_190_part_00
MCYRYPYYRETGGRLDPTRCLDTHTRICLSTLSLSLLRVCKIYLTAPAGRSHGGAGPARPHGATSSRAVSPSLLWRELEQPAASNSLVTPTKPPAAATCSGVHCRWSLWFSNAMRLARLPLCSLSIAISAGARDSRRSHSEINLAVTVTQVGSNDGVRLTSRDRQRHRHRHTHTHTEREREGAPHVGTF